MDIKLYFFENSTCAVSSVARLVPVGWSVSRSEHKISARYVRRWTKTKLKVFFKMTKLFANTQNFQTNLIAAGWVKMFGV